MSGHGAPAILVVEDENVVAMDLASTLEKLHYEVVGVAATGEEAIALASRTAPALVLMDIHLRGDMDGITAAEVIQQRFSIPVVYLTAYSDQSTLERARVTYPFGYVLKPFDEREIDIAIQTALYRHRMERALRDSEKQLEAILTSIGDAVIATESGNRITFLNRAAEVLLGWASDRAKGRLLQDVLHVASQNDGSRWLVRAGDEPIPVELIESPVLNAAGVLTGYVTVARDLSERLRAQRAHDRELIERAARLAAEQEQERARLKGEISLALGDISDSADQIATLRRVASLIANTLGTSCVIQIEDPSHPVCVSAVSGSTPTASAELFSVDALPDTDAIRGSDAVIRSGEPAFLPRIPEAGAPASTGDPRHLEALRKSGFTSYICVPLLARQRIIGALSVLARDGRREYEHSDLDLAQQIADRVALALDNARLFREAQEAKVVAERLYAAEQSARAEAEALFRVADAVSEAQLDLATVVRRVTDEATAMVGAKYGAFFYNVMRDDGEAYMLYTLSGAPHEAFDKFGLPRNTPIFGPTFAGQAAVRSDDVREDPRYGQVPPHYGMPQGHLPVTSYLAVPVVSRRGGVIGGLFFGHPDRAKFTEQHERMARALAAHAAVTVDNARLFKEARDAEERLARLVRELERAVRFSEMFVGILGHDLRNPLSGITTAASLVLTRADSERIAKPVSRILSSAGRMSRMIDQILDFTTVRLGRGIPVSRRTTDLAEICRLALDELKTGVKDSTEVRLESRGDSVGNWDPDRMAQLVSNLAGNALQHRVGGTAVSVSVDGTHPDRVVLVVRNRGSIPPEILPVIFEPLRSREHRKREGASGLGLGLYISQKIALAHGGEVRVESEPSAEVTCFTVDLPRSQVSGAEQVFGSNGKESVT